MKKNIKKTISKESKSDSDGNDLGIATEQAMDSREGARQMKTMSFYEGEEGYEDEEDDVRGDNSDSDSNAFDTITDSNSLLSPSLLKGVFEPPKKSKKTT